MALKAYKTVALSAADLQRIIALYTSWTIVFDLRDGVVQARQAIDDATIRENVRKKLTKIGYTLPAEGGRRQANLSKKPKAKSKSPK